MTRIAYFKADLAGYGTQATPLRRSSFRSKPVVEHTNTLSAAEMDRTSVFDHRKARGVLLY
jgi:hypothetical protein